MPISSICRHLPVFAGKYHRHGKYSYLPAFCQPWERVCAIERSYPNVGVNQKLKGYLEYLAVTNTVQNSNMGSNDKV